MEFLTKPYMMAFWFGALTAVSLPIGAMLGILWQPSSRVVAAIMAFGAGNLLSALTLELIEPSFVETGFWPISIGCVAGCLTFVGLNQMLDKMGGYMRKASTMLSHVKAKKRQEMHEMAVRLGKVELLRALPPEEMHNIIPLVSSRTFAPGEVIFRQGDPGAELYLIESGSVRIEAGAAGGGSAKVGDLGPGDTFGEMALLWHEPRAAGATAAADGAKVWEIHREDFEALLKSNPALRAEVERLAKERKQGLAAVVGMSAEEWSREAVRHMHEEDVRPSAAEMAHVMHEKSAGGGVALSMWLGIFLDGIPESLVIGASMIGKAVSPALIGGLFFANLPEAMSSGTIMKKQGKSTSMIFWMWMSLCIMTGIGALIGNLMFVGLPPTAHSLVGGIAAGAMLAMVAQTMLPEAYEHGGWLVGVVTVLGFLSALMFRALGHGYGEHEATKHALRAVVQTVLGV